MIITQAKAWRFAILWFVIFSINSLGTSIMASLTGSNWDTLNGQQHFLIVVAIITNWTGVIGAYLSKAAKKMETGQLPFDDTQIIAKT